MIVPLYYKCNRYEIDTEDAMDFDLLRLQIMSLLDVPVEDQQLFCTLIDGPLNGTTSMSAVLKQDSELALLRHSESYIDPLSWRCDASSDDSAEEASLAEIATSLLADTCTKVYFGELSVVQPAFALLSVTTTSPLLICQGCAASCVLPGTAKNVSFASDGTAERGFACCCAQRGPGLCLFEVRSGAETDMLLGPVGAAVSQHLRADFARQQEKVALGSTIQAEIARNPAAADGIRKMADRISSIVSHVDLYRDATTLVKAQRSIPVATLCKCAYERVKEQRQSGLAADADGELLHQLVVWFKRDFFRWTNNMKCGTCHSTNTAAVGGTAPNAMERVGLAGVTEIHACRDCNAQNRFPRYNHPAVLLDWRQGRCGEWANCFTLCCLALGFSARHITDWTDHVWTEVWSSFHNKWLHVDSCECAIDSPLVYESGWGKKLSYVIAAGLDEVVDVTRRYTKRYSEVLSRRNTLPEESFSNLLASFDKRQFLRFYGDVGKVQSRAAIVRRRKAAEQRYLEANVAFDDGHRRDEELTGRISGSLTWRAERHELGDLTASRAPASATSMGWSLLGRSRLRPAMPKDTPIPAKVRMMSSFGAQIIAMSADCELVWTSLKVPASSSDVEWKKVALHPSNTHELLPLDKVISIAAVRGTMTVYALVERSELELWHIFFDTPSAHWLSKRLHVLDSSQVDASALGTGSLACMGDKPVLLAGGMVWMWPTKPSNLVAADVPARLEPLGRADGCRMITGFLDAGILAYCDPSTPLQEGSEDSAAVGSARIVCPYRIPPTISDTRHKLSDQVTSLVPVYHTVGRPFAIELQFLASKAVVDLSAWWACVCLVGQPSEKFVACSIDIADYFTEGANGASTLPRLVIEWPSHRLPTEPGWYELRLFPAEGYSHQPLVGHVFPILPSASAGGDTAWVPLCPASNVEALCSTDASIVAYTSSEEIWQLVMPHDAACQMERLGFAQREHSKAADVIATAADVTLQPLQARIARLFKQLTQGCGRAPGSCVNAHCAAGRGAGALAPNAAAVLAYQLATKNDPTDYCP